ncbi:SDR family NAD(P)-dependent oxidoreductase [Actinoallomurus iriomotensis]|uniref:Short-chain dehydrogenase n=1 Tax=Actinoallomurus iriomotensis TaxID=478107 RepID=A0A9W6SC35_9ACTN|nr:SDR family oxidoreductase [Actinoallomurus iriomotensis]GLY89852.1 short-chain dehydrogenase [Actinoallomurus iriomotensis]
MTRIAVITGGASGIGRAIATSLVLRGDSVVVADLDKERAESVAARLSERGTAEAAALDVTDAEQVAALYRDVAERHGRLDLVFNNAGIAVGGRTDELTLDHWNKTLDVNLRGVIHGVHAAYPILLEQGHGHIVNTASLAGLVPAPLMLPYTTTKHAVVGLSLALRAEAAPRGVRVSVVCPGFVDTPLLDNANPDLPATKAGTHAREAALKVQRRLYTPEALARDVLRGVEKNQAMIVAPASARAAWRGVRLSPEGAVRIAGRSLGRLGSTVTDKPKG